VKITEAVSTASPLTNNSADDKVNGPSFEALKASSVQGPKEPGTDKLKLGNPLLATSPERIGSDERDGIGDDSAADEEGTSSEEDASTIDEDDSEPDELSIADDSAAPEEDSSAAADDDSSACED
jgi:hypothetical protein